MNSEATRVWYRAALERGGSNPREGDAEGQRDAARRLQNRIEREILS